MAHDGQIDAFLEEILETGRPAEDVCARRPDLLREVQSRLRKLRVVEAQIDSLFPSEGRTKPFLDPQADSPLALPSIPGYDVQAILGHGGMGIVYRARHLKLNRDVALKMILTGSYASRQDHLRFVREAESVATLRHPNIVQIYEIGEVDGHPFYTMEYVGGGSLADRLAGAIQPARDSAKRVGALARAVQAAHACGIIHRDLKPANILVDDDDTLKITDFGLARRLDQDSNLTNTGARIGTPNYMAPEQMAGNTSSLGPPVDVFALGAMLYEMLTGRPPFRGENLSDTERKLATEDPTPPSRINARVPRDLETICLKCLEKDPASRYASAEDLGADLERFLLHEPIRARPITPAERALRWIRRNPFPAALAGTSIVLVGLMAIEATQEWSEAAAQRAERARLTARFESGVNLVQEGRFAEARAILGKLGDGGFENLRQRIDRILNDLDLVEKLEAIGIKRAVSLNTRDPGWLPHLQAAREYEAIFARAGLGTMTSDPASVAHRIDASDVRDPLIAALDDWAACESDEARRNWVLEIARLADTDANAWEKQYRDPAKWMDREELVRLAETAQVGRLRVQQLRALGDRMAAAGLDATAFRTEVQAAHVDSLLANLSLADTFMATDPQEAIRYDQAALAIRPRSATAHNNLGVALANVGRAAEAVAQYEQSLDIDPKSAAAHFNLGLALSNDRPGEAIKHLEQAIELNSGMASSHRALGELFLQERRYADAEASLRRCLSLLRDKAERDRIIDLIQSCAAQSRR